MMLRVMYYHLHAPTYHSPGVRSVPHQAGHRVTIPTSTGMPVRDVQGQSTRALKANVQVVVQRRSPLATRHLLLGARGRALLLADLPEDCLLGRTGKPLTQPVLQLIHLTA